MQRDMLVGLQAKWKDEGIQRDICVRMGITDAERVRAAWIKRKTEDAVTAFF